ncbi:hypothetical protein CRG98_043971 [Punica granatum]|uniref:Uncharacterized protein n=1 Tax=Punica granatum TaxID=22663 RepID=A0A2I0HVC5_PUNGR|nr:hypothetical protein CRG98_043971 [Punica granatum]
MAAGRYAEGWSCRWGNRVLGGGVVGLTDSRDQVASCLGGEWEPSRPRCSGDRVLICRRSDLLLGLLPVGLSETGLAAGAIVLLSEKLGSPLRRRALLETGLAAGAVILCRRPALLCQMPALLLGWLCFTRDLFFPWGSGVFDLPEVGLTARVVARCSAGCWLCRRGDCGSLEMPRSCDEGLEL